MHKAVVTAALCAVLASTLPSAAQAQIAPQPYQRNFYAVLSGGLTYGGDKLATVRFTDGDTDNIKAGGLAHFAAGVLWQPGDVPMSIQVTFGYHLDDVSARNGDLRFSRYPLEGLAFYNGVPNWRFGLGLRYVNSPRLKTDLGGVTSQTKFRNATGFVGEVGYEMTRNIWISGRYVNEEYEAESFGSGGTTLQLTGSARGDHGGVYLTFVF